MDGAAFLGTLRSSFKLVYTYNLEKACQFWTIYDKTSGTCDPKDPRLRGVDLPTGRSKSRYCYGKDALAFKNDVTGEETFNDPRLRPELLRSRGVELETFVLI